MKVKEKKVKDQSQKFVEVIDENGKKILVKKSMRERIHDWIEGNPEKIAGIGVVSTVVAAVLGIGIGVKIGSSSKEDGLSDVLFGEDKTVDIEMNEDGSFVVKSAETKEEQ